MSSLNAQRGQTSFGPDGLEVPRGAIYESLGQRYRYGGKTAGWLLVGPAQSELLDAATFNDGVERIVRELKEARLLLCAALGQDFIQTP